ncbi:Hint domain-containing protein [uncultured Tateyamaria sp.]|uniref:Hint domain-containing protein n=1 Tax=uncultured Tateyamaria sp. TaxID=455651 RepID=UPI00261E8C14|nr:Hint domain-containing protein [uncultured Tateyamaria sp.]
MVARTFAAFDSESLVVQSSSSAGIVGNPIINNSDTPDGTVFTFDGSAAQNVTLDDTSGSVDTFEDDQSGGHTITDGAGLVSNGNGVEAESIIRIRALDIDGSETGPIIELTVFSQNGVTGNVWGFATDTALQDGVSYVKVSGSNIGSTGYNDFIPCFGPDTLIDMATGHRRVGDIRVGDAVMTLEHGPQPVRWIGRTTVRGYGALAPVRIAPGALGNDTELTVSQEHRMYFDDDLSEYLFGSGRVLIAAKHLCGLPEVSIAPCPAIEYTHFMFDRHQIVFANGVPSESFFLSELSMKGLSPGPMDELLSLFPSLSQAKRDFGPTAATALKRHEASLWCQYAHAA